VRPAQPEQRATQTGFEQPLMRLLAVPRAQQMMHPILQCGVLLVIGSPLRGQWKIVQHIETLEQRDPQSNGKPLRRARRGDDALQTGGKETSFTALNAPEALSRLHFHSSFLHQPKM